MKREPTDHPRVAAQAAMSHFRGMETSDVPPAPLPDCEGCGGEAAAIIDGKGWCVDCYHGCGSCCAGDE